MAKFIVEVEEGHTQCEHCPFADSEICVSDLWAGEGFNCQEYDFSEVEIKKVED